MTLAFNETSNFYLYLPESGRVVFINVYDKDEAEDLTPEERKEYTAYDAERIRTLRTGLGFSQPYFSRILNVSPKTV